MLSSLVDIPAGLNVIGMITVRWVTAWVMRFAKTV